MTALRLDPAFVTTRLHPVNVAHLARPSATQIASACHRFDNTRYAARSTALPWLVTTLAGAVCVAIVLLT